MISLKEKYPWMLADSEPCACQKCIGMCNRPCWPLPEEAAYLIEQGYADRMMNDWWVGGGEASSDGDYQRDIQIICPANTGNEGQRAPSWPTGTCTMLNAVELCDIHDVCKPHEGRVAHHDSDTGETHRAVAMAWNTDLGRSVVKLWKQAVYD